MPHASRFKNRLHAGRLLAQQLACYAGQADLIVLALPRGGVPVGFAVAKTLGAELDVLLVRKLGMPRHEEYAMGAIGSGGVRVLQPGLLESGRVSAEAVEAVAQRELREIARRDRLYRGGRPPLRLEGRTALLVDDGLATGATMRAAVEIARALHPVRIVVAVPVGAPDSLAELAPHVDQLVCLLSPFGFRAVSQWYDDFEQTGDDEVQDLLATAWRERAVADHEPSPTTTTGANNETDERSHS